jgi:RNA polymerase sigma factor (TIGR02999 family)
MAPDSCDVTLLLGELKRGNLQAEAELIPLVYQELRRIARGQLRNERNEHTLQPTALVHEAYLKLTKMEEMEWQGRSHFFAVAANLMRRILVDHARGRLAEKRGSGQTMVEFNEAFVAMPGKGRDILALDDALERLSKMNERQGRIVELRFFSGLTEEEAAHVLGLSPRTVKRDWRSAKAWLYVELSAKPAADTNLPV